MLTETITWRPVAPGEPNGLPDAEKNVLLALAGDEPGTCEGFLDGERGDGSPLWRDVTAFEIEPGVVTHWAEMPKGGAA